MTQKSPKDGAKENRTDKPKLPEFPPPEEELGGGDFCSLEEQPSTEDDRPLD